MRRLPDPSAFDTTSSRPLRELDAAANEHVKVAVEAAAAAFVEELNRLGHAFERDEAIGPLAFRSALDPERILVLDWTVGVGTQVRVVAPADLSPTGILSPEEQRYFAAVDAARAREAAVGYRKLKAGERLALCLGEFEAEVNNGGFSQFFLNSAGDHAEDTLAALRKVGAKKAAGFLAEAMALFPGGAPPRERAARERLVPALVEAHGAALEALDARYQRKAEPIAFLAGVALGGR